MNNSQIQSPPRFDSYSGLYQPAPGTSGETVTTASSSHPHQTSTAFSTSGPSHNHGTSAGPPYPTLPYFPQNSSNIRDGSRGASALFSHAGGNNGLTMDHDSGSSLHPFLASCKAYSGNPSQASVDHPMMAGNEL
ncbi:hypothetical protein RvY_02181 [Ramazzottius varieornatus]|uniref:Uncharacterized protein n=1 Tax=Ramazzottius varieornatus TaxID=947166 RepID=A0A1D1UTF4_RAMVA|nr:hypothetical protein RvY_02181 [Ramazzottius varieornatus]